jgi:hypothetical protein
MKANNLRSKAIRVAYQNPDLRPAVLKAIKTAEPWKGNLPKGWTQKSVEKFWGSLTGDVKHKVTKCMERMEGKLDDPGAFCGSLRDRVEGKGWRSEKKASGFNILKELVDYDKLVDVNFDLEDLDKQSAKLLGQIISKLAKELELPRNSEAALNRLRSIARNGSKWDPALLRNNVFKTADLLGIRLPSGMFASATFTFRGDTYPNDGPHAKLMAKYLPPPDPEWRSSTAEWDLYRDWAKKARVSGKDLEEVLIAFDLGHGNAIIGGRPEDFRDLDLVASRLGIK